MRPALAAVLLVVLAASARADEVFDRANGNDPDTLDPQKYELVSENNILRDLFEGLTTTDADNRVAPGQAESWSVSSDGLTWTFKLRDGLVWSDGEPVTADDFVAGARRAVDPATAAKMPDLTYKIENARRILDGQMKPETLGVSSPDRLTIVVKLTEPSPLIPVIMGSTLLAPIPRHVVAKFGDAWVSPANMVTNGAYTLESFEPSTVVKLKRNPRFRDAASVAIPEIAFYPSDDQEAALKRFRSGEFDFLPALPASKIAWAQAEMPAALKLTLVNQIRYLEVNQRREALKDVRVRRALAMAIDREALATKIMQGAAVAANGYVPRAIEGYGGAEFDFAGQDQAARVAEARRLLAEAGFDDAHPLTIELRTLSDSWAKPTAVAIMSMWKAIGVDVTLQTAEAKAHFAAVKLGDYDIAMSGWFGADDPETFMWLFQTGGALNESGFSDATFDALSHKAESVMDKTERYAAFAGAERILLDQAAMIPLFWTVQASLQSPDIAGFAPNARGTPRSRFARFAFGR